MHYSPNKASIQSAILHVSRDLKHECYFKLIYTLFRLKGSPAVCQVPAGREARCPDRGLTSSSRKKDIRRGKPQQTDKPTERTAPDITHSTRLTAARVAESPSTSGAGWMDCAVGPYMGSACTSPGRLHARGSRPSRHQGVAAAPDK